MRNAALIELRSKVSEIAQSQSIGRVVSVDGHLIKVSGLQEVVSLGDRLRLFRRDGSVLMGDVLGLSEDGTTMLPDALPTPVALSARVMPLGMPRIHPDPSWIGRVIDPYGAPLDGRPLTKGPYAVGVHNNPPDAVSRKPLGKRLKTGFHLFNTILPIVKGQRVGIFAGSGVGKSRLLADLIKTLQADVVVLALVGERGREINEFTHSVLGDDGMMRTVVIAASADTAPSSRMRCSLSAMRVAEYFRDLGRHVLIIIDSVTRFAEAQREVAVSAGEFPSVRGFPPSTPMQITKLAERAGPGVDGSGDITAVFSVLVAASDMNEPIADMLRGVLDGHIVLDRDLADRGHFPAVDVLKSVSRSLPEAAEAEENKLNLKARRLMSRYEESSALVQAGLYVEGTDQELDHAILFQRAFTEFCTACTEKDITTSFETLRICLRRNNAITK